MQDAALKNLIRVRAIAKRERERNQPELLKSANLHAETIRQKLSGLLDTNQFFNFAKCGQEQIFKTCKDCGDVEQFDYACSLKWCPRCQWKITERRRQLLAKWTETIAQPKHLVLTQKNS